MTLLLAVMVLLALIAATVTVVDAVHAPYWRGVALERRRSWEERTPPSDGPMTGRAADEVPPATLFFG